MEDLILFLYYWLAFNTFFLIAAIAAEVFD